MTLGSIRFVFLLHGGDMIDDENGYAINDAWINRVQDIVDYCTSLDMYTIINIHHDGASRTAG